MEEKSEKNISYIVLICGEALAILMDTWFVKLAHYCSEAYSVVGYLSISLIPLLIMGILLAVYGGIKQNTGCCVELLLGIVNMVLIFLSMAGVNLLTRYTGTTIFSGFCLGIVGDSLRKSK